MSKDINSIVKELELKTMEEDKEVIDYLRGLDTDTLNRLKIIYDAPRRLTLTSNLKNNFIAVLLSTLVNGILLITLGYFTGLKIIVIDILGFLLIITAVGLRSRIIKFAKIEKRKSHRQLRIGK
ncbi:hypothetical protein GCM10011391_35350 [Pullulanibacillus camelliae]|uniref:Uncharacterized protein n=1 Tax=Pullulanibacillus camelliae TaxID=1707096 RepID=A0A8J2YME2_9BACL|nr:hypothetical protein [Pullulanibacillus camelliae]GGE53383.1 hypothetical protein GCM10011391_35350 [Pullulanibacillus camelliae]